jgi:hypothetical protein
MKNFLSLALLLGVSMMPAFAQSRVRVVHASADAPAVDILVDGTVAFQGLKFRDYTNYTPVPAGMRMLSINVAGTSTTAIRLPFTLADGVSYTFYAFGKLSASSLNIIGTGDDVVAPAMDSTKVRIVHGASTAPPVDIFVTAPFAALPSMPLLMNVPFTTASHYLTVPAGDYQARVTPTGTKTVAIDSRRLRLTGGTVRTIVAVDAAEGGSLDLLVLNDVN